MSLKSWPSTFVSCFVIYPLGGKAYLSTLLRWDLQLCCFKMDLRLPAAAFYDPLAAAPTVHRAGDQRVRFQRNRPPARGNRGVPGAPR